MAVKCTLSRLLNHENCLILTLCYLCVVCSAKSVEGQTLQRNKWEIGIGVIDPRQLDYSNNSNATQNISNRFGFGLLLARSTTTSFSEQISLRTTGFVYSGFLSKRHEGKPKLLMSWLLGVDYSYKSFSIGPALSFHYWQNDQGQFDLGLGLSLCPQVTIYSSEKPLIRIGSMIALLSGKHRLELLRSISSSSLEGVLLGVYILKVL